MAPNSPNDQNHPNPEYPMRLWSHTSSGKWLESMGPHITISKGHVVAEAGEAPAYCYYILRGRVMSYEYTMAGRERIYKFYEEGSMLLEANLMIGIAPLVSFVALTQLTLICIARDDLIRRIYADPQVSLDIISSISFKFLSSMGQVREATHHNVPWKVCNLLLVFAERYGVDCNGKLLIKEKISQQLLANLLGVNRITLVRIIKELRDQSLIEQINGFYSIRSVNKLKQFMAQQANET